MCMTINELFLFAIRKIARIALVLFLLITSLASISCSSKNIEVDKEDKSQYRFYLSDLSEPNPSENTCAFDLWKKQPLKWEKVQLEPTRQYLLGVERDVEATDNPVIDTSFSASTAFVPPKNDDKPLLISVKSDCYLNGIFFPGNQEVTIHNGIVRWFWEKGVIFSPTEKVEMPKGKPKAPIGGLSLGIIKGRANDEYVKEPVAPIVRGSERELQLTIKDKKAVAIRKIFVLKGSDLSKLRINLHNLNLTKTSQFPNRFVPVSATEQTKPDVVLTVKRGQKSTHDVSITAKRKFDFMVNYGILSNPPDFIKIAYKYKEFKSGKFIIKAEISVDDKAQPGDYYFRIIHAIGDILATDEYTERIAKVSIL